MAQYRVVPGPTGIQGSMCCGALSSVGTKDLTRAAEAFQAIIAREAQQGWRFVCFDSTKVHNACCCLSKSATDMKLLVFAKD